MAEDLTIPDPAVVLELLTAFRRSKIMFAGVSLGVFDRLSAGPMSLESLARELGASSDGLERLLDASVGLGLLARRGDLYENTAAAATYLCSSSPRRLTGYINYSNDVMWNLWRHLEDAVREGTHRWKQAYGWDGPIFSHFFRDEAAKREFLMGMHGFGLISSPHVVECFDLSRFKVMVDLGGATGHLAVAACRRYPDLRAIVFDLPEALPLADEFVSASDVSHRMERVAGDFFVDPLPRADLFALGRIVHDWSDDKVLRLLRRVHEHLEPGGAILLAEKILWPDRSGPSWAHMQNLNMLAIAEGRERTLDQYEQILVEAGFERVAGCRTPSPLDAIMAIAAP